MQSIQRMALILGALIVLATGGIYALSFVQPEILPQAVEQPLDAKTFQNSGQ